MKFRQRILFAHFLSLGLMLFFVGMRSCYELQEQYERFLSSNHAVSEEQRHAPQDQHDRFLAGQTSYQNIEDPEEEAWEIVLLAGLPAVLISLVCSYFLLRQSLVPIKRLTDVLERTDISNLGNPIPRSGNGDELDRLASVFNEMKLRLRGAFIQSREFTLHASHELKTPLSIMHGTLEQLLADIPHEAASHDRVVSLLEEVQRLSVIVGQLTFLANADAGTLELREALVPLDELVREVADDATILAAGAGISVQLSECEPVYVKGDRMRLRQLLLNLVDNAVKYNRPLGSIEIAVKKDEESCVISVTNTGVALSTEKRGRVFERFFRGDPSHNSSVEGSGLGLSIAKSIVAAHQGDIAYDVLHDGRTCVTVLLPLKR